MTLAPAVPVPPAAPPLVALDDLRRAAAALRGVAVRTPLLPGADALPAALAAADVWLKPEMLQRGGAFKLRGAYTFLARLDPAARARGVVAPSSGNHAQAVALAARLFGVPATVVMPSTPPTPSAAAPSGSGARVELAGRTSAERAARADAIVAETGAVLVPPFDHPDIVAGQGTIGLEIAEDRPDVRLVLVPVGGGGLSAGVAAAVKLLAPNARVVGVEPAGTPKLSRARAAGAPVTVPYAEGLADGLLGVRVGDVPWAHHRAYLDDVVAVDDRALPGAVRRLLDRAKLVAEPSGAVTFAALAEGVVAPGARRPHGVRAERRQRGVGRPRRPARRAGRRARGALSAGGPSSGGAPHAEGGSVAVPPPPPGAARGARGRRRPGARRDGGVGAARPRLRGGDAAGAAEFTAYLEPPAEAGPRERRPPDLVLLDILMPDGDGVALLERAKRDERWRDVPVLMLSSAPAEEYTVRALGLGAADFVRKPVRPRELVARVQAHLRAGAALRTTREALRRTEEELARARADAENRRKLVDILHEVTGDLAADEIYHLLARRVARALSVAHCAVVLAAPDAAAGDGPAADPAADDGGAAAGAAVTVATAFEDPRLRSVEVPLARYPEVAEALATMAPVLIADVATDARYAAAGGAATGLDGGAVAVRSALALPFTVDPARRGAFLLRRTREQPPLTRDDVAFAEAVIGAAVAVVQRAHVIETTRADNARLEHLATTDPLTALLNRRALSERLTAEMERALRYGSTVALLLLDLDHFKHVNDTHGHLVGDAVLRGVAGLLADEVRASRSRWWRS
jgi:threonine dehydratase/DNA-binding response OmpR family regulator